MEMLGGMDFVARAVRAARIITGMLGTPQESNLTRALKPSPRATSQEPFCGDLRGHWTCVAARGHEGNHTAYNSDNELCCVWSKDGNVVKQWQ